MNCIRSEDIISTGIHIAILMIFDSFLKQKVCFLYCLINSRPNIKVKLIFTYMTLGMSFYFYIFIYHFLFFYCSNRRKLLVDNAIS